MKVLSLLSSTDEARSLRLRQGGILHMLSTLCEESRKRSAWRVGFGDQAQSQGLRRRCWLVEKDELWRRYGAAQPGHGW
jgi:hypothetical protein